MGSNRRRSARAPAPPVLEVDPALPTLGRSRARLDTFAYYLLCQPGRLAFKSDGGSKSSFTKAMTVGAGLIPVVCIAIFLMRLPGSGPMAWLALVIGGVLALLLLKLAQHMDTVRRRHRPGLFARVTPRNTLAWQMCEMVHDLVKCRSWVDRTVDPQRRIPVLLWAAVRRSLEVEEQRNAVARARSHPDLAELVREASARTARERAALHTVVKNLRAIRDAARQVDHTRDERVRQQRAAREEQLEEQRIVREKQLEEQQLRSALVGTSASVAPELSEHRADAAAGLAAEAETIAALLADTDRLLHT